MQPARALGNASPSGAEGLFDRVNWNTQRWRQPKKKTAEERGANGENKYAPVKMDFFRARQTAGPKRDKWMKASECEHHPKQAPGET
jgi:hypothetical protein